MPVTFEGDVGGAGVAETRYDHRAIGRRVVLDQLDPVARTVDVGDLDVDAIQRGHALDQAVVARRARRELEPEQVAEERDHLVQVGHGEGGVIERQHGELDRHDRPPLQLRDHEIQTRAALWFLGHLDAPLGARADHRRSRRSCPS